MPAELKAVLFDLDGTLVDSASDLGAAADQLRTDRGLPPLGLASYRSMAGAGARGMLGVAFGITPDHPDFPLLREEFFQKYERRLTELTRPFEGVAALVEQLGASGLRWGVVTNKPSRFSEPLTRGMALFASSGVLVSGDTTPYTKPHPAPLLEAARVLGVEPGACVYVGDDARDIVAGQAAGMMTVAACYGYLGQSADTAQWGADAAIDAPMDLLSVLALATAQTGLK
ncbi:HAD-IA family hydrolase [Pseudorhodoferax sp.]|uniref:HAD-IA family hydrolase n=1 Tax=Pseudorhodoferax sp. TaxID=1993553 RepID=UPI002DD62982|nr:HAD-IA family hydrolase [Pseudorhodoferax sp.]